MRLRFLSRLSAASVALATIVLAAPSAQAQSFFEQLFGLGSPKPAPAQPAPQMLRQPAALMTPGGHIYQPGAGALQSRRPLGHDEPSDERSSGAYRTICVRMCDGYYFPISNATTRAGFYNDQRKCTSTCGEEARLFHHPVSNLKVDEAVDNSGRMYGHLQTAFLYRKKMVNGCQCKQAPWSEAEVNRHKQYAAAEEAEKARQIVVAEKKPVAAQQVAKAEKDAVKPSANPVKAPVTIAEASSDLPVTEGVTIASATLPKPSKLKSATKPAATMKVASNANQRHAMRSPPPISGGMGLGAAKPTWPGDAPNPPIVRIKVPRT